MISFLQINPQTYSILIQSVKALFHRQTEKAHLSHLLIRKEF